MDTAELTISHMVVGGAGLARDADGRVVFVDGVLPGETVRARITKAKKDFATAEVVEVLVASADRVRPPCTFWHRGCGGCDWQHIAAPAQLPLKLEIVREALTRTARLVDPTVQVGAAVEPWGYRTTVRLARGPRGGLGFRARRSHEIVEIDRCPVADAAIDGLLETAVRIIGDGASETTIRIGLASGEHTIGGLGAVHEIVAGHRFRVSAHSFFQSSPAAAELLVDAVSRAIGDIDLATATVVDAYGGIGLFALTVGASAREVVLVESSPSSCADARHNLAQARAAGTYQVHESMVEDWRPVRADLVIADPARAGLGRAAAATLAATEAPTIVLVSCDTGSLARDVRVFGDLGYVHRSTEVLDVFPNTSHIETVTAFVHDGRHSGRELA